MKLALASIDSSAPRPRKGEASAVTVATATHHDAAEIAALRCEVAEHLTRTFGRGRWSTGATEAAVARHIRDSRVLIARRESRIVATLRLSTKKPWAIDPTYFTACTTPVYLHDMAVAPDEQRRGVGKLCVGLAIEIARALPGDAIRLDAWDAPAGAGPFYVKCGFREVGRVTYRKTPLVYYELVLARRLRARDASRKMPKK